MGAEAMTSALLWAFAAVGFWTPHMEALAYPDLAACEQDRPRIERNMMAMGYSGVFTVCRAGVNP